MRIPSGDPGSARDGDVSLRRGLSRQILARSFRASLVVGTLLTALNQGDLLLRGEVPPSIWWKVPLTYLVPFLVATWGALGSTTPGAGPAGGKMPSSRERR